MMGDALAGVVAAMPEGVVIKVRAQPRSSRNGIDSVVGDALKVRIRAAPVDGKANAELIETLADAFGLPKSRVKILGGESSRQKRVCLSALTRDEAMKAMVEALK